MKNRSKRCSSDNARLIQTAHDLYEHSTYTVCWKLWYLFCKRPNRMSYILCVYGRRRVHFKLNMRPGWHLNLKLLHEFSMRCLKSRRQEKTFIKQRLRDPFYPEKPRYNIIYIKKGIRNELQLLLNSNLRRKRKDLTAF